MIAFTFSGAASRFDGRRTLVVEEANNIGHWFDGAKMIVGTRLALSVEQALYHGYAQIVG